MYHKAILRSQPVGPLWKGIQNRCRAKSRKAISNLVKECLKADLCVGRTVSNLCCGHLYRMFWGSSGSSHPYSLMRCFYTKLLSGCSIPLDRSYLFVKALLNLTYHWRLSSSKKSLWTLDLSALSEVHCLGTLGLLCMYCLPLSVINSDTTNIVWLCLHFSEGHFLWVEDRDHVQHFLCILKISQNYLLHILALSKDLFNKWSQSINLCETFSVHLIWKGPVFSQNTILPWELTILHRQLWVKKVWVLGADTNMIMTWAVSFPPTKQKLFLASRASPNILDM